MAKTDEELYPFHKANIHERRLAARIFRAFPLVCVVSCVSAILYGAFKDEFLLLSICAALNVALWLWITSTSLLGMAGSWLVANELKAREHFAGVRAKAGIKAPFSTPSTDGDNDSVLHLIVLPNYKEDESLLAQSLAALSEAEDSQNFHVVLAMEAREGEAGAEKATNLQTKFGSEFAAINVTHHPIDLIQDHNDDSISDEVPGKASNVKWAVDQSYQNMQTHRSNQLNNVILTVADADCLFHPEYFSSITKDFNALREKPGSEHQWCMWQAPQLSYRDHWRAPVCSRVWTYISSMYEFGGVSGLYWGGHHMVFSSYSMPLQLAANAQSWDGDVIAEDHHAYIKTFFYSAHVSAMQSVIQTKANVWNSGCQPMLQVRPIFLPVKSSPVICEGYWQTYVERWNQAKRHAQGLAELPYAMLVMWDALCTLPLGTHSPYLFYKMGRIFMRLLCMHILPICQAVALVVMTLYWIYFRRKIPMCPITLRFSQAEGEYPLCASGGAWNLVWPMAIPFFCIILANYMMVSSSFITPSSMGQSKNIWHKEDGGIEPRFGSKSFATFVMITVDCAFFLSIMMVPYGLFACLLALWNVCFYGNRFKYVTAAKASKEKSAYGTMSEPAP